MKRRNWKPWIGILVLCAIEQGIKLVINHSYLQTSFPILPPILFFSPMFNRSYSWVNSMFQLGIGKWMHSILVAFMMVLILLGYWYVNKKLGRKTLLDVMFAFLFSGALCSLIDKLFWGGSLDYILLRGFFTFDLKDVYINVFVGLFLVGLLFRNKAIMGILELTKDGKVNK